MSELNLGPPLGGGPSLEDETKAMQKGRGRMIAAAVFAAVVAIGGLTLWMMNDQPDQYGTIGRQVNRMKSEHFDRFWSCALPGTRAAELRTDQDVRYHIHKRARSAPPRFAAHVRSECMVRLTEHDPELRSLIAPQDLHGQLDELGAALRELREGWEELNSDFERTEAGAYDEDRYSRPMLRVTKGWYDYRRAHGGLNDTIRSRIH